jgi:hypothetical protein
VRDEACGVWFAPFYEIITKDRLGAVVRSLPAEPKVLGLTQPLHNAGIRLASVILSPDSTHVRAAID